MGYWRRQKVPYLYISINRSQPFWCKAGIRTVRVLIGLVALQVDKVLYTLVLLQNERPIRWSHTDTDKTCMWSCVVNFNNLNLNFGATTLENIACSTGWNLINDFNPSHWTSKSNK